MKFKDCECTNQEKTKVTKKIRLANREILVEDAPAYVCQDCGEIYFEGQFISNLEKKLRKENKKSFV